MAEIRANERRHGMALRPYQDLIDYVATLSQSTYLILRDSGQIIPSSQPFSAFLLEHGPDYPAFLFHEHYVWNSARLRTAYGTLEMRPACQQPWPDQMAAAALMLGLIEASTAVQQHIESVLGPNYWDLMSVYHQQVVRFGLAAPQPAPHFLDGIVEMARDGLTTRGRAEEQMLTPLFGRLSSRYESGPAYSGNLPGRRHSGPAESCLNPAGNGGSTNCKLTESMRSYQTSMRRKASA